MPFNLSPRSLFIAISILMSNLSCQQRIEQQVDNHVNVNHPVPINVTRAVWGTGKNEQHLNTAYLYTLTNSNGVSVKVSNWGAYLVEVNVPDKHGKFSNAIVGHATWEDYYHDCCYLGPIIGRYANRIAHGKFKIDAQTYQLDINFNKHHIHGGTQGFSKQFWHAAINPTNSPQYNRNQPSNTKVAPSVTFTLTSPDGEEGYPGNLTTTVTYTLNNQNELSIDYTATTDKTTPINLISHSLFNLANNNERSIEQHQLMINADNITVTNHERIPTGEFMAVKNTRFDFTELSFIGEKIKHQRHSNSHTQMNYDDNWVFNDGSENTQSTTTGSLKHQVSLYEPHSGRLLEILTQEPGIQVYTDKLNQPVSHKHRRGIALEPQHFPDSPNHPHFPNTLLSPNDIYKSKTVYRFSVKKGQDKKGMKYVTSALNKLNN